jgi:dephospho-CoA kinase
VLRVGLTGGVASGKSTVGRLLAARGAHVRDADAIVERLYASGQPGALAIAAEFGPGSLDADGRVDRRALAAIALGDPKARRRLETLIHPLVRSEIASWFAQVATNRDVGKVAVVEAALLVETGSYRDYDRLVVVSAPVGERRRRALAAGWRIGSLTGVIAAQVSNAERERVADYIINNESSLAALELAVNALWRVLCVEAARPKKSCGPRTPLRQRITD